MTISSENRQMIETPKKTICIIDGHGGGIGAAIIKYIRQFHENRFELVALGTNAIATAGMLKAGAHKGASGENALVLNVESADLIIGPISITWPNASLGEITSRMAGAIMESPAPKILLPLHRENVHLMHFSDKEPLPHQAIAIAETKIMEVLHHV
jgi:hypothetical protein